MLKFKNAEVDSKFESDFDKNPIIHICSDRNEKGKSINNGYKGPLDEITVDHAERLIKQESNLVRAKGPKEKTVTNAINTGGATVVK